MQKFNLPEGLQLIANGTAWTVANKGSDFKAGFDYNAAKLRLKVLFNLRTLLGDAQWSYQASKNLAVGGQFNFEPQTTNLTKYDFGFSWNAGGALVGLKHESTNSKALEFGRFLLFTNHAANADQTVGSEFSLDWKTRAVQARFGLAHKFNGDTSAKVKVNHDGHLDAVLKHKLNSAVTASIVTGASLRNIVGTGKHSFLPVGLAFDIKA